MNKDSKHYRKMKADPVRYAAYLERKRQENRRRSRSGPYEAERRRRWRAEHPATMRRIRDANHAVEHAIEKGLLTRPLICSRCPETKRIQGHHWSYEKEHWLDVIWLCVRCHMAEHQRLRRKA